MTLGDALKNAAQQFAAAGLDTPQLDARLLLQYATGQTHTDLILNKNNTIAAQHLAAFESYVARRLQHEPVARIIGHKEFWGLDFALNAHTLVPRPESELVVECVIATAAHNNKPFHILDIGTGSGCLLLACLHEVPHAHGVGVDISPEALTMAQHNAQQLYLEDRAQFIQADILEIGAIAAAIHSQKFEIIISNPPYIPQADIAALEREVQHYDPMRALDGGVDGLDFYRAIIQQTHMLLKPKGVFIMEFGVGQSHDLLQMVNAAQFVDIVIKNDLSGMPRVIYATKV